MKKSKEGVSKAPLLLVLYVLSFVITILLCFGSLNDSAQQFWYASTLALVAWNFLVWQAILSLRRSSILWKKEYVTQLVLHKWSGFFAILIMIAHPIAVSIAYGVNLIIPSPPLTDFDRGVAFGRIALFASVVLLITGILLSTRLMRWRLWKYVHLLGYIILPFVVLHASSVGVLMNTGLLAFWFWLLSGIGLLALVIRLFERFGLFGKQYAVSDVRRFGSILDITVKPLNRSSKVSSVRYNDFVFLHRGFDTAPFSVMHNQDDGESIRFGIRVSGKLTQKLTQLRIGDTVRLDGPFEGSSHTITTRPKIYVAGGIGITRYFASVQTATQDDILFWLCRDQSDAWVKKELEQSKADIHVLTSENGKKWYIEDLLKLIPQSPLDYDWYLCGPAGLIKDYQKTLRSQGVPENQITPELFALA